MKKKMIFVLTMLLVGLMTPAFAGVQQKGQDFSSNPGWTGTGNTLSPHNFGYSLSTRNAGGAVAGEMGGYNERSPKATYADTNVGTIDLANDNLSLTFKVMIDGNGNSGLGYFNAADYASAGDIRGGTILGFRFDDRSIYGLAGGGSATDAIAELDSGVAATIIITYTAATQECSWQVNSDTPVTATQDLSAASIDSLGMMTHGDSSGAGNNLWFDDINYTVGDDVGGPTPTPTATPAPTGVMQRTQNFDAFPGWEGRANGTSPQSFGYSGETNNAGGAGAGEIGGYIERTPIAWYADDSIGSINLANDDLSMTFNCMISTNGNPSFGYFNAGSFTGDMRNATFFGFRIDDVALYPIANGSQGAAFGALEAGTPATVTMTYTAATQTCSWQFNAETPLEVVVDLTGSVMDHIGITSFGDSAGAGCEFWVDDLDYTVGADANEPEATPTPTPTPLAVPVNGAWVENFNRTSAGEMFNTDSPDFENAVKMTVGPTMTEVGWLGYYPPGASAGRRSRLDNGDGTNWLAGDRDNGNAGNILNMTDSDHSAGAYAYCILAHPIDFSVAGSKIEFDAARADLETDLKIMLRTETDGWIISEDLTFTLAAGFQQTLGGAPEVTINLPADVTEWFAITNAATTPKPDLSGLDAGFTNDADALTIGTTALSSVDLSNTAAFGIYLNTDVGDGSPELAVDGIRLTGDILIPNVATQWLLME